MRKAIRGLVRREKGSAGKPPLLQDSSASPSTANGPGIRAQEPLASTRSTPQVVEERNLTTDEAAPPEPIHPAAEERERNTPDALDAHDHISEADTDSVSEDLWSRAYVALAEREPELVKDYERHIGAWQNEDETPAARQAALSNPKSVKETVESLQDARKNKQWKFSVRSQDKKVRDQLEKLVKLLSFADGIIKQAVSAQPYAALAWSAVSVFLPLISGGFSKNVAMVKGFATIGDIQLYWRNCEDTYLRSTSSDYYQKLVEPLSNVYSKMLEYQLRAICHLSKKQLSRAWSKLSGQDDWVSRETEIVEISNKCKDHIIPLQRTEIQQNFLVEMQKLDRICQVGADIAETIRSEKKKARELEMLKILRSAAGNYIDGMEFNNDPVNGTCEWFYNDEKLSNWRDSDDSGVFWITAGPGCGKSVLARSLIVNGHLESTKVEVDYGSSPSIETNDSTVCFFFFKDESKQRSSIKSALCAILHRLFVQRPEIAQLLLPTFDSIGESVTGSFTELWNLLMRSAQKATCDIICVLDALDECATKDRTELFRVLGQLGGAVSSPTHVKFLITSRPYDDIKTSFQTRQEIQYFRYDADDRHKEISQDISLVIDAKVGSFTTKFNERDRDKIAKRLKSQGTNTYLWLHLTFGIIESNPSKFSRQKDVEALLSDIPSEVSEAYEKILSRSADERMAGLLLQIILAAPVPLSLGEANFALALALADTDITSHAELEEAGWEDFKTTVKNLCGLIVSVYDGKLSFIHLTAREFLVRNTDAESPARKWAGRFADAATSHQVLTRCCMQYLLLSDFSSRILFKFEIEAEKYKFLRYASGNWPSHFKALDEAAVATHLPQARQLCSTSLPQWHTWGRIYINKGSVEHISAPNSTNGWSDLAVASFTGLTSVVQSMLSDGVDVNARCRRYKSALYAAIMGNQEDTVALLIASGAEVDRFSTSVGTPLDFAVRHQKSLGMIRLLMEKGASPFKRSNISVQSPFSLILGYAATLDNKEIFYALLAGRFDVSTPEAIVATTRHKRIINSGSRCRALVLNLLDDENLEEICTEEHFTILMSEPTTLPRIFRLLRNSTCLSVFLAAQDLADLVGEPQISEGAADAFRELMLEARFPSEKITDNVLCMIALHSDPNTLRMFIENSPENCDIKDLFSAAVANQSHRDMSSVVLEFAEAAISEDEEFQDDMLNGYEAERWETCVWHVVDEEMDEYQAEYTVTTVRALLRLSHHSDRIKKCMVSAVLLCAGYPSSSPLKLEIFELLIAVLDRFGHKNSIDADLLAQAAAVCDLQTLQLVSKYSSGISMVDEKILCAVADNSLHGKDIMKFLLQRHESEAIITQRVVCAATFRSNSDVLRVLFDSRPEEIVVTASVLVLVRKPEVLNIMIECKRDEVAAVASAALDQAATSSMRRAGDVVPLHNLKAAEILLNCCPSSWFTLTECLVFHLVASDERPLTLLCFSKSLEGIEFNKLRKAFQLWKPEGAILTPATITVLYGNGNLEELASVADSCGCGGQLTRDVEGWHTSAGVIRRTISNYSAEH
ncbi:hypothetical protein NQ176_g3262 [Zarea fungicola]|uniref:Uncharacterized protein n=1 Tax=Zarea fungicola TaxID=93591 RepID=A0ACC1NJH3_9HYPO|nr:hypothetical protein NQ176_g3262 [Lecanicillium fungicola]